MCLEKIEKVFYCILMEKICELLNIIKVGFIQTKQIKVSYFLKQTELILSNSF